MVPVENILSVKLASTRSSDTTYGALGYHPQHRYDWGIGWDLSHGSPNDQKHCEQVEKRVCHDTQELVDKTMG